MMKTRKSNKQKRAELLAQRRLKKQHKKLFSAIDVRFAQKGCSIVPVDVHQLANYYGYGMPYFIQHGRYADMPFQCRDCGSLEIWTSKQQKWWYEKAQGDIYSTAIRCSVCRKIERERKATARRIMQEGLDRKAMQKTQQGNIDWKQMKLERAKLKRAFKVRLKHGEYDEDNSRIITSD